MPVEKLSAISCQLRSRWLFSVVSHSAFALFILRVGWFERSETQHNPYKPALLSTQITFPLIRLDLTPLNLPLQIR